jgi:hypothetical protein
MTENEIQLWTDETFSQFAISFNTHIIVKTDENVSYTNMIDETSYVTGYDINWHYTLAQWVIYYFSDKYISQVKSSGDQPRSFVSRNKLKFVGRIGRKAKARQKAELKCHFCNLKCCIEEERSEHEKFWHKIIS